MLRNYFRVALRHLLKHKMFSVINIFCLAVGITFSMIIGVYIINQRSINAGIKNVDHQYILTSNWKIKEMGLEVTTIAPLAKTIKNDYPSLVKNYYRFNPVTNVVSAGDKYFKENIAIGDTTLIDMYGFPLLYGNPKQAFANNSAAVITEQLAQKLFGTANAINKTITISNTTSGKQDYTVSAVLKNMPYNSVNNFLGDEGYQVFIPFTGNTFFQDVNYSDNWGNAYIIGMVELQEGVTTAQMKQPFRQMLAKYAPENFRNNLTVELAPVRTYYLDANNGAVRSMIGTLGIAALFILLMAVINFVNINIGTSSYRLKEIGLRKVFGGERKQLIFQFITEACIITFIAAIISCILYQLLLPSFNQVLNTTLPPIWQFNFSTIGLLAALILLTGFVSGIYPAFVLSAKNVIHAVKGKVDSGKGGLLLRKTLLVIQFTLAIIVFISALTVSKQVSYVFNKDLGYSKDQLMVVSAFPKQWDSAGVIKMESIKKGLEQVAAVKAATLSFEIPDRTPPNTLSLLPEGSATNQPVLIPSISADEDFAQTFGLRLLAGNFFDAYKSGNSASGIVINESAAKALGFTDAVGKRVTFPGANNPFTITGVVKDFNYSSLQQSIGPLVFVHTRDLNTYRYLTVKLGSTNILESIEMLKKTWKELSPAAPFEYTFMDERFAALYQSELQLQKAANIATLLNLVIVLLGIFGVVAITLAKRNKEISLRKVLGASVRNIIVLFVKDYAWLILIANCIAWPVAYIVTHKWLQQYAYRIQQDIVPYLSVCLAVYLLASILVIAQCFKTANANPVKSLRAE